MKICIYTDNHFSKYSSILTLRGNKYSVRLENQINSLNWVNKISKEKGCQQLICNGDFFSFPSLNAEELTALKDIEWNDLPKIFLVGNHELGLKDNIFNSTNALSKIGQVIYNPTLIKNSNIDLIFLPYILETDRKSIKDYINDLQNSDDIININHKRIIFSHNDLKGIRYGNIESKIGFDLKDIESNCDLFINGHLHNGEKITKKIINLGNLTGENFTEDGFKYKHNIMILDTDTLNYELIENPYAINFYKIEINSTEDLYKELNKINNLSVITFKIPNNILKECKEIINNYNILKYKIVGYDNINEVKSLKSIKELTDINHIEMFNDYFIEKYGKSDIILEELSYLR